ncbi:ferrochelatase [Microbacterium sp. X-17]|uniref:ferrochelatase n=1 Tax=Microbacterium sp. X-17 TaxID=3144404 RepID=UPI0031F4959F
MSPATDASPAFRPKPERATGVYRAPGAVVPGATSAVADGRPYATDPAGYDAVLLLGFGGPEGQDDVIPFLRNVTRGRGIPEERLEEVAHHYRHFGGVSPINAQNAALREAVERELAGRGMPLPVALGNRNWAPYVSDAVRDLADAGHRRILAIATSAYSSYSSCRQYREDLADALEETGLGPVLQIDKVRPFFDHPGFVAPLEAGLAGALAQLRESGLDPAAEVEVLFSTHSIPDADAALSGPSELELGPGGAYVAQHRAVAEAIMRRLGDPAPWQLVFQSRSGPPSVPWLAPDVNDAIAELPARGRKAVVIVPLGFVSDHMEVLWDLDGEATETAEKLGLVAIRTATPGVDPAYVAGLADLVAERIEGRPVADRAHLTELGPWYDVCRPGCCANARLGTGPALAGIEP